MIQHVIVSRHPAAIALIAEAMHPHWHPPVREGDCLVWRPVGLEPADQEAGAEYDRVPVFADAKPQDVAGKVVWGNVPLHLAALALEVRAVEFAGAPPRGQEYTVEDMRRAGARIARYVVRGVPQDGELPLILSKEEARQGGYCV